MIESPGLLLLAGTLLVAAVMFALWLLGIRNHNFSYVDIGWSETAPRGESAQHEKDAQDGEQPKNETVQDIHPRQIKKRKVVRRLRHPARGAERPKEEIEVVEKDDEEPNEPLWGGKSPLDPVDHRSTA